jgi:hypothetical protein
VEEQKKGRGRKRKSNAKPQYNDVSSSDFIYYTLCMLWLSTRLCTCFFYCLIPLLYCGILCSLRYLLNGLCIITCVADWMVLGCAFEQLMFTPQDALITFTNLS